MKKNLIRILENYIPLEKSAIFVFSQSYFTFTYTLKRNMSQKKHEKNEQF